MVGGLQERQLMRVQLRLTIVFTVVIALAYVSAVHAERYFNQDNTWYTKIPADPTLLANSSDYIADILINRANLYSNEHGWSTSVWTAGGGDPLVTVDTGADTRCAQYWGTDGACKVPIPPAAVPPGEADGHMTVFTADGLYEWDLYRAVKDGGGNWSATHVRRWDLSTDGINCPYDGRTTVRACPSPHTHGLIMKSEIDAGLIDHAIQFSYWGEQLQAHWGLYPCQAYRTGVSSRTWAMRLGERIQLDPSIDVTTLGLTAAGEVIATAMQDYGMVFTINCGVGCNSVYAESDTGKGWSWGSTIGDLSGIPINQMRVVEDPWTEPAIASQYYVDKAGDDGNLCTSTGADACLTIGGALAKMDPVTDGSGAGRTVTVYAGTYAESFSQTGGTTGIHGGDSWASPFTIEANGSDTVIIQPASGTNVLLFEDADVHHVIFDGIDIDGTNVSGDVIKIAFDTAGASHHIRFNDAVIVGDSGTANCVLIDGGAAEVVDGNEFIDSEIHSCGNDANAEHGIFLDSDDNIITGCTIHGNAGAGIQVWNSNGGLASNLTISHNKIYDNGNGGIILYDAPAAEVFNNLIYENAANSSSSSGIRLNTDSDGALIYNNTVTDDAGKGIWINSAGCSAAELINNIVYNNGSQITDAGTGTVNTTNLTDSDPQFTDAASDDYTIPETSPATDQGTSTSPTVTDDLLGVARPEGPAYDIGAYEYVPPPAQTETCPNNLIEGSELCDGTDIDSTCQEQGFGCGTLACNGTCDGYVTTACTNDCLTIAIDVKIEDCRVD
jgi:parallel beta-helix repeat protein